MRSYWWSEIPNLGDTLAPLLLKHFADIDVELSSPADADIISIGSVLDVMPTSTMFPWLAQMPKWRGIVAGSGSLHASSKVDLSEATVLGLRGHLSKASANLPSHAALVLGDPGLLASELVHVNTTDHEIGVVPHVSDVDLFPREWQRARVCKYALPVFIDVRDDPLTVVRQIGSCSKIVTSALHGAVVADAFSIPRRLERFPGMMTDAAHQGNDWKFADYSSALGMELKWGALQEAPSAKVSAIQSRLFDMFQSLSVKAAA